MSDSSRNLRRALAAVAGAILGGIATLGLVMLLAVGSWLAWIPVPVSAIIGSACGDRGVAAVAGVVSWL